MVYIVLGVGGGVDVERRGFIFVWMGCFDVKVREVKRVSLQYQFGVKKIKIIDVVYYEGDFN